jgi:hypothetical protein
MQRSRGLVDRQEEGAWRVFDIKHLNNERDKPLQAGSMQFEAELVSDRVIDQEAIDPMTMRIVRDAQAIPDAIRILPTIGGRFRRRSDT